MTKQDIVEQKNLNTRRDMEIKMTQETVNLYKDFLLNPYKYKCTYKPLRECFEENDKYIPQDKLFENYIAYIKKPLPKFMFYIIMKDVFGEYGGCEQIEVTNKETGEKYMQNQDFGYKLKLRADLI